MDLFFGMDAFVGTIGNELDLNRDGSERRDSRFVERLFRSIAANPSLRGEFCQAMAESDDLYPRSLAPDVSVDMDFVAEVLARKWEHTMSWYVSSGSQEWKKCLVGMRWCLHRFAPDARSRALAPVPMRRFLELTDGWSGEELDHPSAESLARLESLFEPAQNASSPNIGIPLPRRVQEMANVARDLLNN
jgi:hypothetical protein